MRLGNVLTARARCTTARTATSTATKAGGGYWRWRTGDRQHQDAVPVMNKNRARDVKGHWKVPGRPTSGIQTTPQKSTVRGGRCDVVVQTPRFNVNRITVKPGEGVLMQMPPPPRAEHWVILAGTGQITVNGSSFLLTENQSTFIPISARSTCCLENPGRILLEVLEIQSGSYWVKTILSVLKRSSVWSLLTFSQDIDSENDTANLF